jgi:hypothetical protein
VIDIQCNNALSDGRFFCDGSGYDCPTPDTVGFPTGRFVHEEYDTHLFEFDEDRSYRYYEGNLEVPSVSGKYEITGDLYAEMTHDYTARRAIPVTYNWTYDGQKLTFHLWGEDVHAHRKSVYNGQAYVKVE